MKKIIKYTSLMIVLLVAVSCKKTFLEQQPVGAFNQSNLQNADGINKLLIGAYSLLNGSLGMATTPGQMLFGSIRGGEALKGSGATDQSQMIDIQKFQTLANNSSSQSAFQWFYDGVYRCNLVLTTLPAVKDMTDAQKIQATAEARFLRAHYHFMLKRVFGNVPFLDESSIADARVPNTDATGNYVNIWPKIKADFDYARKNLPPTQGDLGRPNQWAAQAYYAKVLIYMGSEGATGAYNEALRVLDSVINLGVTDKGEKYALLPNYHDNFNADKENNAEWVWGVQHSVNDGSTLALGSNVLAVSNGNLDALYTGTPNSDGPSTAFGFFNPSQWFVDHFRVNSAGLPYLDMFNTNAQSLKSDNGVPATSPFTPDTAGVDPRLDWSVGRRGIPYLDYGVFPGQSWIRDQPTDGPYMSKKYFTLKKDIGKYTFSGYAINALNIAFIRYADVLLLDAEMQARVGSLNQAEVYVNMVRSRMVQNSSSPDNWVKQADGLNNAANYRIAVYPPGSSAFGSKNAALQAILYERTLELGLEGHRAYDLIRFGNDDQLTDVQELKAYIAFESKLQGYLAGGTYSRSKARLLPIPQTAIDNSQKNGVSTLKQNPGY